MGTTIVRDAKTIQLTFLKQLLISRFQQHAGYHISMRVYKWHLFCNPAQSFHLCWWVEHQVHGCWPPDNDMNINWNMKTKVDEKITSSQAPSYALPVQNYHRPSYSLTEVRCRATSVAKNWGTPYLTILFWTVAFSKSRMARLFIWNRVAKCHRYGRYICVKILEGWDKKFGRPHSFVK